jgi:hypothetical protein
VTLQTLVLGLDLSLLAAGMVCWICAFILGFRASRHRNPGAPYRWLVDINPYQAAWFADQLDDVGLGYRRQAFRFQFMAVGFWAAFIVLSIGLSHIH